MKQNRKTSSALVGILLIVLILVGDLIVGAVDSHAPTVIPVVNHDGTQLGTWYNMPSSCPSLDACMLFGNSSNVAVFPFDGVLANGALGNIGAYLSVGCLGPSLAAGPTFLQLQYAIYVGPGLAGAGVPSNSTNWQTIDRVYINNNATYTACLQGTIPETVLTAGAIGLNSTSLGWVFRVVGIGGGGIGDNPRFSFVNINLVNLIKRLSTITIFSPTTTAFTYTMEVSITFTVSTVVQFQWIADNITSTGCGLGSTTTFHCWENGASSCTFAPGFTVCPSAGGNTINFVTPFSSAVNVKAVALTKTNLGAIYVPFTVIPLFVSQSITV